MVERWFREITDKRIRRGTFQNVPALIAAIKDYVNNHNQNPRVFVWSAPVERLLTKVAKYKEVLDSLHEKGTMCWRNFFHVSGYSHAQLSLYHAVVHHS
jgi:hypothetical protein